MALPSWFIKYLRNLLLPTFINLSHAISQVTCFTGLSKYGNEVFVYLLNFIILLFDHSWDDLNWSKTYFELMPSSFLGKELET